MIHGEEEELPDSKYTLVNLIEHLQLSCQSGNNLRYRQFEFFNSIITMSHLPNVIDSLLWLMLYLFVEIILIVSSLPAGWFSEFIQRGESPSEGEATRFLFSIMSIQMATAIFILLSIFLIVFQRQFNFGQKKKPMSTIRATFLHILYVHIPLLMMPTAGLLNGFHILSSFSTLSTNTSEVLYSLLIAVTFTLLSVNTFFFSIVTKMKLTISKRPFEYWNYPFSFIDYLFYYFIGLFFPLTNVPNRKIVLIMSIFQIFYGFYTYVRRKIPVFVHLFPHFLEMKIATDAILFGFFSFLFNFMKVTVISQTGDVITIHFVSFIIAAAIVTVKNPLNWNVLNRSTLVINKNVIRSSTDSLSILRFGITLSLPAVTDFNFIKWVMLWRFSPEILADVFRLCFICNYPIKEIIIPHEALGPLDTLWLQFLVFQVNCYLKLSSDKSKSLEDTLKKLSQGTAKLQLMCENFWTTLDYDQITLNKIGRNIKEQMSSFELATMNFPKSKEVYDLYFDFLDQTFHAPSMVKVIENNPYTFFDCPTGTIYSFLADKSKDFSPPFFRPKPTTDEKLAQDTIEQGPRPLLYFFRVLVFVFLLNTIFFWAVYNIHIRQTWNSFAIISELQQASVGLATNVLLPSDALMVFPDPVRIQEIIGVPIELARLYRAPMFLPQHFEDELQKVIYYIEPEKPVFPVNVTCRTISLSTLLNVNYTYETTIDMSHRRCYLLNALFYLDQISSKRNEEFQKFKDYIEVGYSGSSIFLILYISLSFLAFIFVFVIVRNLHNRLLDAVRLVKSKHPNFREHEFLDLQFWVFPIFVLYLLMIACTIGLFVAYNIPIYQSDRFVEQMINETSQLSTAMSSLQMAVTTTEFSMLDGKHKTVYEDLTFNYCISVYKSTNSLTNAGISPTFASIPPLDIWSLPNRNSFNTVILDICRYLISNDHSVESFNFLAARAFFMYNMTKMLNTTLPSVFFSSHSAMQSESSVFWWFTAFLILVDVIIYCIYELFFFRRQRVWFMAASLICLRDNQSGDLKSVIERKNVYLPDRMPFPILVKQNHTDIITYANPPTKRYTNLSIGQLIGQPLHRVWKIDDNLSDKIIDINGKKVSVTEYPIDDQYILVIFDDISTIAEREERYEKLLQISRLHNFDTPASIDIFNIEMRFNADAVNCESLFSLFEVAEESCPKVKRISCGPSFYNAIVGSTISFKSVLKFFEKFVMSIGNIINFKASVVHGIGTIVSLAGNDAVNIVCGRVAKRAHFCTLNGNWGRIYVDYTALDGIKLEKFESLKDIIIPISDIVKPDL